jgi:hypothetical protein
MPIEPEVPLHAHGDSPGTAPPETARVRRAIRVVLRGLAGLPPDREIAKLVDQAERLLAETDRWDDSPPLPEVRDRVMQTTLSIHIGALRALALVSFK